MNRLRELINEHCAGIEDYEEIAAILNEPTVIPNPLFGEVETSTQLLPITLKDVLSLVPVQEVVAVYKNTPQLIEDLKGALEDNDREYLAALLGIAATSGSISQQTAVALAQRLQETVTTETPYPEFISGPSVASANGLGFVTSVDVQRVVLDA